jgi:hypothetical protein
MEKDAKEAKPVKGRDLNSRLEELLKKINDDRKAKEALRKIVERGCDEAETLKLLFWFCGGTQEEIRGGLAEAKKFGEFLLGLSDRLKKDIEDTRQILPRLPRYGYTSYDPTEEEERRAALGVLQKLADDLAALSSGYRIKGIPQGGGEKRKGKTSVTTRFNPTAGRGERLVELIELVSDLSGPTRQDYLLLAPLIRKAANDDRDDAAIAKSLQSRYRKALRQKTKSKSKK